MNFGSKFGGGIFPYCYLSVLKISKKSVADSFSTFLVSKEVSTKEVKGNI